MMRHYLVNEQDWQVLTWLNFIWAKCMSTAGVSGRTIFVLMFSLTLRLFGISVMWRGNRYEVKLGFEGLKKAQALSREYLKRPGK